MRADRLLRILMLLQSRRRVTAGDLAHHLEVSVRTIQRDMEALGAAGVPVYATRGVEGGWELAGNYRTTLTGMTPVEALAIVAGRPPRLLEDLGLGEGESALTKLLAALGPLAREAAERARQRIHVDLSRWGERAPADPNLTRLQEAALADRLARVRYGGSKSTFVIAPVGLVAKGMVWYLVAIRDEAFRTYRVQRFTSVRVLDDAFERPADFDLATHWESVSAGLAQTWPSYTVTLRVRGQALDRLRWSSAKVVRRGKPGRGGWTQVVVDLESSAEARSVVLSLGADAQVLEPVDLRQSVTQVAERIAARRPRRG